MESFLRQHGISEDCVNALLHGGCITISDLEYLDEQVLDDIQVFKPMNRRKLLMLKSAQVPASARLQELVDLMVKERILIENATKYAVALTKEGFDSPEKLANITKEDLDCCNIVSLMDVRIILSLQTTSDSVSRTGRRLSVTRKQLDAVPVVHQVDEHQQQMAAEDEQKQRLTAEAEKQQRLVAEAEEQQQQRLATQAAEQKQRLATEVAEQQHMAAEKERLAAEAEHQKLMAAKTEQQRSTAEAEQLQQRLAAEAEAEQQQQRMTAEAEQQRLAAEFEQKRLADEAAEQQRLTEEAEQNCFAEESAEQQRLAAELAEREQQRLATEAETVRREEEHHRIAAEEEERLRLERLRFEEEALRLALERQRIAEEEEETLRLALERQCIAEKEEEALKLALEHEATTTPAVVVEEPFELGRRETSSMAEDGETVGGLISKDDKQYIRDVQEETRWEKRTSNLESFTPVPHKHNAKDWRGAALEMRERVNNLKLIAVAGLGNSSNNDQGGAATTTTPTPASDISKTPCDRFRLNLIAPQQVMCLCGFPKVMHNDFMPKKKTLKEFQPHDFNSFGGRNVKG